MTEEALVVELLPARQGDCILLHWWVDATAETPGRRVHVLIDGGPARAYTEIAERLARIPSRRIDLLVLTHIDADHIEGAILLVNDADLALTIDEVWYNGYPQLAAELAAPHGEILGALVASRGIAWNAPFAGRAARAAADDHALTEVTLAGDVRVTVLAPTTSGLTKLRDEWTRTCTEAGLTVGSVDDALRLLHAKRSLNPPSSYLSGGKGPDVVQLAQRRTGTDPSIPNQSSIVLLVERRGAAVLLAGDSTAGVLEPALRRLLAQRGIEHLALDAFKLPHHGSANNITSSLVMLAPARRYLFSTNGAYFHHPDDSAVATVIAYGPADCELVFNYRTPRTSQWADEALRRAHDFRTSYPADGEGAVVTLQGSADG